MSEVNTRSVVVGLLLAALLAGSLVTFSLLAGSADDPAGRRVVATQPDLDVDPVIVEETTVLGTQVRPQQTAAPLVVSPLVVSPSVPDAPADTVLGIQLRNPEADKRDGKGRNKDKEKGKDKGKGKGKPGTGSGTSGEPPATHTPTCPCRADTKDKGGAKNKDNTPNGHAYGYHKQPGQSGLARGHDKSNGNTKGHDKKSK